LPDIADLAFISQTVYQQYRKTKSYAIPSAEHQAFLGYKCCSSILGQQYDPSFWRGDTPFFTRLLGGCALHRSAHVNPFGELCGYEPGGAAVTIQLAALTAFLLIKALDARSLISCALNQWTFNSR